MKRQQSGSYAIWKNFIALEARQRALDSTRCVPFRSVVRAAIQNIGPCPHRGGRGSATECGSGLYRRSIPQAERFLLDRARRFQTLNVDFP
jgi:hypothetical protein